MRRRPSTLKEPNLILFYNKIVSKNKKIIFLKKIQKWISVTMICIISALTFLGPLLPEEFFFISIIFFSIVLIAIHFKINFVKNKISFSKEDFKNVIHEVTIDLNKKKANRKPIDISLLQKKINIQKNKIKKKEEKFENLDKEYRIKFSPSDEERNKINLLEDLISLEKDDLLRLESNFELALETLQLYEKKDAYYKASLDAAEEFLKNQFGVAPLQKLKDIPKEKRRIMAVKNY